MTKAEALSAIRQAAESISADTGIQVPEALKTVTGPDKDEQRFEAVATFLTDLASTLTVEADEDDWSSED